MHRLGSYAAVLAAAIVFAGCDDLVLLPVGDGGVPPVAPNQHVGLLSCSCPVQLDPTADTPSSFCFTPTAENVGQVYAIPPNCEVRPIESSDVGVEYCGCARTNNSNAADYPAIDAARLTCENQRDIARCLPLDSAHEKIVTPGDEQLTPEEKCERLCAAASSSIDLLVCPPVGTDGGPCVEPRMPHSLKCLPVRAAVLEAESCEPVDTFTDPPNLRIDFSRDSVFTVAAALGDDDDEVTVNASGHAIVDGDHCVAGSCTFKLLGIHLAVDDITLFDQLVTGASFGRTDPPVVGTVDEDGAIFFPAAATEIFFRGSFQEVARAGSLPLTAPILGVVDDVSGEVVLALSMSNENVTLTGTLVGAFRNRAPRAAISAPSTAECSQAGAATVQVDASATMDPDGNGDLDRFLWFVDGTPAAEGRTASVVVPLGTHVIQLRVIDAKGLSSSATKNVVVQDTTPPELADFLFDGPACLWPPNHDYAVLRVGEDFHGTVTDACDPAARLAITAAVSDQPDDDSGDGQTVDDVVRFDDRVCLRAERDGRDLDGRLYTVQLHALDAAGNASDPIVHVRVGHDQGGPDRCLEDVDYVSNDDPLCAPPPSTGAEREQSGAMGCTALGTGSAQVLALCVLLVRLRRTRKSR